MNMINHVYSVDVKMADRSNRFIGISRFARLKRFNFTITYISHRSEPEFNWEYSPERVKCSLSTVCYKTLIFT